MAGKNGNSQLFVDHQTKNSHHSGTPVVEFNGSLAQLGSFIEGVPSKVSQSVAKVAGEFSSSEIPHDENFQSSDKADNLNVSKVCSL